MNTQNFRALIAAKAPMQQLQAAAKAQGLRTMMEDGMDKLLRGVTTPSEVIHAVFTAAGLDIPEDDGGADDEITDDEDDIATAE